MKIAIINPGYLPNPAVLGGAVECLIDSLVIENNRGHKITVYTPFNSKALDESKKQKYHCDYIYIKDANIFLKKMYGLLNRITNYSFGNSYINKVIRELKRHSYDFVIVENIPNYVLPISSKTSNRIILHQHNNYFGRVTNANKRIIDNCYMIITVSDFVKKHVLRNRASAKVKTVYNGVDTKIFKKVERDNLRDSLNIRKDDIAIGFVGRIVKEKGILELLDSFKKASTADPRIKLVLVGSQGFGDNNDVTFINQCKQRIDGCKDKVIFTGFVEHNDLYKYYSILDVQVVPSIIDDACPLSVLEGMSVGIPLIVSDSGGIPEEVSPDTAYIVSREDLTNELYNAINCLCGDSAKRESMRKSSTKRIRKFSTDEYAKNFFDSIEGVI